MSCPETLAGSIWQNFAIYNKAKIVIRPLQIQDLQQDRDKMHKQDHENLIVLGTKSKQPPNKLQFSKALSQITVSFQSCFEMLTECNHKPKRS